MNNIFEKLERWFEHWEPTLIGLLLLTSYVYLLVFATVFIAILVKQTL